MIIGLDTTMITKPVPALLCTPSPGDEPHHHTTTELAVTLGPGSEDPSVSHRDTYRPSGQADRLRDHGYDGT